jgi:DNA-binding beta-propeller fold protein YncE
VGVYSRDAATGALTQRADGSGCIVTGNLAGCTTGRQLAGANAVTVSADDDNVYVTSLISNSVTSFRRAADGGLSQLKGTAGCVKDATSTGCSLGHALSAPEGIAAAPGGSRVYAAAFNSGAVDTFSRADGAGALTQKPAGAGCVAKARTSSCLRGHSMHGVGGVAVSPDGKHVYATAFASDSLGVFQLAKIRRPGCAAGASSAGPAACAPPRRASS